MNDINFQNKTIWITGASRGIGLAIAKKLSDSGAKIILSSRNQEALSKIKKEFKDNSNLYLFPCDISTDERVQRVYEKITNTVGEVDVLINNAGVTKFASFNKSTIEDFDKIIGTNLRGTFLCIKSVLNSMLDRKQGIIINIISVAAIKTFTNSSIYAASKAGLLAMSRSLREEVRNDKIKIIDILPGATETEIWSKESLDKHSERMMKPDDVAEVVVQTILLSLNDRLLIEEIVLKPQGGDL